MVGTDKLTKASLTTRMLDVYARFCRPGERRAVRRSSLPPTPPLEDT